MTSVLLDEADALSSGATSLALRRCGYEVLVASWTSSCPASRIPWASRHRWPGVRDVGPDIDGHSPSAVSATDSNPDGRFHCVRDRARPSRVPGLCQDQSADLLTEDGACLLGESVVGYEVVDV